MILQKIQFHRTLIAQLVFTVLAFAVMVASSYAFMSAIVHGALVRNAEHELDFAEERVLSVMLDSRTALEGFAEATRDILLRGGDRRTLQKHIDGFSQLFLVGGQKTNAIKRCYGYFATLPGGPMVLYGGAGLPQEGQKPGERRWYQAAVAAGGGIVETVPYYSNATGETYVTYAKSITDGEGRRLGVVCLDARIDAIGQDIVRTALTQGGYGMLLDQNLLLLSHPNADFVRQNLRSPDIPVSIFADDLQNGRKVSEQPMKSYKGEPAVVFFRKLSNGWNLGLVTPEDQYYRNMSGMATFLVLLGALLAAALCVILIRIDLIRAKADEESRQKSRFLANMSHEIRTPINAIVGMTAIGRTAANTERKDYCFTKISTASKHLLGVINDILDISKIEANKFELSPTEFSFEKMLQQAVNVSNFRIDEKYQKLTVHIDKDVPKTLVADDQRLAQVITNLLGNAVKFTPEHGSISLKARLSGENNGICTIEVEVADTGIGISPEQQAGLFQVFQQAESSTSRKYGGSGLGLSISKSIVEMMGGEIRVASELGKGTTFSFTIKAKRGEEAQAASYCINWSSIRMLAVDDDPDILVYFQEIISNFGARCEVAASAEEALRLIEQNGDYDMYFVDLKMPGIDGMRLVKKIRAKGELPGTSVVIMISSADLSSIEHEAKAAGVDKFLLKPIFPSTIFDTISECIGIVNDAAENLAPDIDGIFAGHHILFAEDIDINREIVIALLEPTLVQIDCAENGLEAVEMFSTDPEKYDMIFMDVQMPEMDGYEASRHIRALDFPKAGTIPIVAMTANVFKEDVENCLAAGMSSHLGKPLAPQLLLETIAKYLGKRPPLAANP